jgi:pyruvate dehydrogenase E2 component (dihydrolipoamide acetyltransferase)
MTELTMPRLSDSMEEGTILKWLVADGEPVARGQELVEIETDKATIIHTADADGTLEILAPEGTTLAVGEPIGRLGDAGEARPSQAHPAQAPAAPAQAAASTPASEPEPEARPLILAGANGGSEQVARATPLAKRTARLHQIELSAIAGSGPRGRITRADVLMAAHVEITPARRAAPVSLAGNVDGAPAQSSSRDIAPAVTATAPGAPALESAKGETQRLRTSRTQQLVARRMAEAKATIPHFQVQTEVAMDAAVALRSEFKVSVDGDAVPSLNDLIVKACAIALRRHPRANGSYVDGDFELHGRINVGVAVASEDALVVPVLRDADTKALGSIARETRRLAERVRSGEISPPELAGATFTVSNLGMFGMTAITPVINPPQAAILGVGALRETLARVDGEIVDRALMTLTLSCDHRILYGADAARLLADVRTVLEKPLALAL